jgi:hypothetical protein
MLINSLNQELNLLEDSGDQSTQKAKRKTSILSTTKLFKLKINSNKLPEDGKPFTILVKNLKDKDLKT